MGITALPITLTTSGASALIALWLAVRAGAVRRQSGVSIGDGGNEHLTARMRAQANYVETAPFILIVIGVIELTRGPSTWLWVASVLFLLARIVHPFGMDGVRYCRSIGATVTMLLLLVLGAYAALSPLLGGPAHRTPVTIGPVQG